MKEKVLHWNRRFGPAAFFLGGFLLDVVTLGRIDHWFNIVQQGVYLLLIAAMLELDWRLEGGAPPDSGGRLAFLRDRLLPYRMPAIHFLFGSLLSSYTIFYFKSASLFTSAIFVLFLCGLLLANELPAFQKRGRAMKYALLSLALVSYLGYVVPTLLGFIGVIPFLGAVILAGGALFLVQRRLGLRGVDQDRLRKDVLFPGSAVLSAFLLLYVFHAIPPVPLSVRTMGIYHGVEKDEQGFRLLHEKPFWKFWQKGDQSFRAREGDRVYFFASIFAPTRFVEKLQIRWSRRTESGGWATWDAIPLEVRGGREEGYRAFTWKQNYEPGFWRVQVETSDGREIGRLYFKIHSDPGAGERQFQVERI